MKKSLVQPFTKMVILHFLKVGIPLEDSSSVKKIRVKVLATVVQSLIPGLKFLVQLWVFLLQVGVGKITVSLFLTVILI